LDHLGNSNTPNEVEQKLGHLPTKLVEVYAEIYKQIEGDTSPGQKRESLIIAENALRLLLCARVLLPTDAFLTTICPQRSGPVNAALLLAITSNLIVQDVEQDTFRLAHLSVREYLEMRPEYTEEEIHSFGAEICLTQLTKRKPRSDDREMDVMEQYAIIYGPFHCQFSGKKRVQDELKTLMKSFLMPRNLTKWMEVLPSILDNPDFCTWGVPWELESQLNNSISSSPNKFLLACSFGFIEVVKDPKIPMDAQNHHGRTGLHLASMYGHDDVVQQLLNRGAKTDVLDNDGNVPLYLAVKYGHLRAAEILLEHDNVTEISEELLIAPLWSGDPDTEMMKLLLDRDEELVIPEGVLVKAIAKLGNELIDLIEFLYKSAHDMQITNVVLEKGIWAGNIPAIKYLLDQDGDISIDEEILKQASAHPDGPAILSCLSKAYPETRIPESVLEEAFGKWRMEVAYILLDWDPELKVSPDLLKPVISMPWYSSGTLDNNALTVERLISHYSETTLSEDILSTAAKSSSGGAVMEVMLKRFSDAEITDTVLQAAVSNSWHHEGFLAFKQLISRYKGEIDIDSLLRAAIMQSNEEAVCYILDQHKEIEITEDLVITSIQVTSLEPTCGLLLDRNPAITVNENILVMAAYMRNKCLQTLLARDSSINISRKVLVIALESHPLELLKRLFDRATGVQIDEEIMEAAVYNFEDPVEVLSFVYQRNPEVKLSEEVVLRASGEYSGEAIYTRLLELYGKLPVPEKLWEQEHIDEGAKEWLLEHGYRPAHIGKPPEDIQERIEQAAILGYPNSVELYVECAGKDATSEKWITIAKIFNAAKGKPQYKDQLAKLLASGVDPNFQRPEDGFTALMIAASNGELAVLKTMLENKAVNIEAVDNRNKRAITLAMEAGKEEVVELLIEHGAIIEPRYESRKKEGDGLWTEITKDLVVKEAIEELGYDFEETDNFFYIMNYLRYVSSRFRLALAVRECDKC
jgi:ankyrin repeat protein